MSKLNARIGRLAPIAPLVLRLVLGLLLVYHGYQKFDGGLTGVEGFFDAVGAPAPSVTAPLVAVLEVVGGIAIVLGLATRFFAFLLAVVVAGAMYLVKLDVGVIGGEAAGSELELAYLAGLVALVLIGPGNLSADRKLGLEPHLELHPA